MVNNKKIGLDVDGVLMDFSTAFINKANELGMGCYFPESAEKVTKWDMCDDPIHFKAIWNEIENSNDFWLNIPALNKAKEFFQSNNAFTPQLYLTHRPVPSWVTRKSLLINGFPEAEVISVHNREEKVGIVRERCDIFIDDLVPQVRAMRAAGINAILYAAPYQISENIEGLPLIRDFSELFTKGELWAEK
jgi:uncharacterized HAD superfamily protein